jgi:hypothetical protein
MATVEMVQPDAAAAEFALPVAAGAGRGVAVIRLDPSTDGVSLQGCSLGQTAYVQLLEETEIERGELGRWVTGRFMAIAHRVRAWVEPAYASILPG